MKMKKVLALVLALAMVLSCVTAFAAMENTADKEFYSIVMSTDNSDKNEEAVSSAGLNEAKYIKDGENVYWYIYGHNSSSSTNTHNAGYNPFGVAKISDSFSGEYVLTNRQKFHHYTGSSYTTVNHSMYLLYNNAKATFCYFGFNIHYTDSTKNIKVSFIHNYQDNVKAPISYDLGGFTAKTNEWYTYQQIWNLDKKVAELHVYDSAGNKVGTYTQELYDTINGKTVSYKNFYTNNFWTNAGYRARLEIANYDIAQTKAKPVTADFDSDLVSVTYNGQEVKSGVATPVAYNEDAVFTVVPKDDYEVTGIVVDGEEIASKSQVTFEDIRDAHTFTVSAKYDDYNQVIQSRITHEDMPETALATSALAEHHNNTNPKNYYNEGSNIMYQIFSVNGDASNRRDWYSGPNSESSGKVLTNDLTGEYVVEHKLKFSNTASDVRYVGDNELRTQLRYSNSKNEDVFGFSIHDDNGDRTANIKFGYTADNTAENHNVDTGKTWTFNLTEWYTIRQVYNFDTMKADMHIYNASGAEVGCYSHDIASGNYQFVKFESIAIQAGCKSRIGLDDLAIYKTIAKPVAVKYDASMGAVKCDDAVVANGDKVPVAYNSATAKAFSIEAKEGYEIADVKVNGESKGNLIDSYEFKNLTADQELEVIFAEKKVEAPTVEVTEYAAAKNYSYKVGEADATSPYTVIMYGKIAGQPENYGFALSNGAASVKLDAKSISENGTFAIRVVGGAILPGSYTAVPYWTDGEGEALAITIAE